MPYVVSKMPLDLVTCLSTASLRHRGVSQAGAQMAWQSDGGAVGARTPKAGAFAIQPGMERCLLLKQRSTVLSLLHPACLLAWLVPKYSDSRKPMPQRDNSFSH